MRKWLALVFALASTGAFAQGTVTNHAVPIGKGPGVSGFTSSVPGNAGTVLTSNGASADPTWQPGGGGAGGVTSVGLSLPSIITVTGSPVTSTGTLTGTLATQTANQVWASAVSGGAAQPAFRALVAADIPAISLATGVTGNLPVANLNSGTSATSSTFWRGDGTWAAAVTSVASGTGLTGGPITGTGTLSLATIAADSLLGNASGSTAVPAAVSIGSCSAAASALTYNTSTHAFGCNTVSTGTGTVTSVATGTGLSGGPVTTTGTIVLVTPVAVANGGTGLSSGTSGGVLAYTASGTLASSTALTANAIVLGGGAGAVPVVLGSLGTTTTVLHGNAAGAPTFAAVSLSADVTGSLALGSIASITNGTVLSNVSGGSAVPSANTVTAVVDVLGSTQGNLLYRNGSVWTVLAPGASGTVLTSGGAAANPSWTAAPSGNVPVGGTTGQALVKLSGTNYDTAWQTITGLGTVTSVATNNGLTGGTITSSGTLGLASVANLSILANVSGGSTFPSANTLTAIIDAAISSTQGAVLYRGASTWAALAVGTSGQVLAAQGAAANPQWATVVTSIATNNGITGGTITGTGTIGLATIIADSLLMNATGGTAAPIATAVNSCSAATSALTYNTSTHAFGCNTTTTGTVTSIVAGTGLSGGTITSAGTISITAPVTVALGGTGAVTLTNHGVLVGATTSAITQLAAASTGYVLTGATSADPAFGIASKAVTIGTTASSSTPTPNADTDVEYTVTALAASATFGAPTGTPVDGQRLTLRIKDNGTARVLSFNAVYRAGTDLALPTVTVISKTMYLGFIWNAADSVWDFVAFINNI